MDDDPLTKLLSQHQNEETILDEHFKNTIAPKIEKNSSSLQPPNNDPKKHKGNGKEEEEDDDQPIGLVHRQPSYSSLHGPLIGKDGVKVDRLPDLKEEGEEPNAYHSNLEDNTTKPTKAPKKTKNSKPSLNSFSSQDNVIAFDEHDDSEDVPIGLTYRQPSFSSMGDHLISKGGDSLADIVPLKTIPIEEAIIEEENLDPQNNNEEEADLDNEEDEEDEENPQVQIVKDLKQKNKDRWQKMGYEPPPNLIQLTRAQSQSVFNQNQVFMQPQMNAPAFFSPLIEEEETPKLNNDKNNRNITTNKTTKSTNPAPTPNSNSQTKPVSDKPKIAHRRCGSNGMKLGEASTSLARMSQALMMCDSNSKIQNDNEAIDEEKEFDIEEEAENESEEEEEFFESDKKNYSQPESESGSSKEDKKKGKSKKHQDKKHKDKSKKRSKSKKKSKSKQYSDSDQDDYSYPIYDIKKKNRNYLFSSSSSSSSTSYDSDIENEGNYYYRSNEELFGRLGEIVKDDESSDVYKAILTGRIPSSNKSNKSKQTRNLIQGYIDTCINNLWVDEASYLTSIIDSSNQPYHYHHHHRSKDNCENDHLHHTSTRSHYFPHSHNHHHRNTKHISPIERLKMKAAEEDANYEYKIQETFLKQKHMLEMLNDEFKEAANDLDAQYSIQSSRKHHKGGTDVERTPVITGNWSPSPAVLELRETIKHLIKAKKYSASQELLARLKKLEMNEAREVSEMIHEQYVNADRLLKERFAMRRALLLRKIQFEIQAINEERQETARRYSKSISRLRNLNLEINETYDLVNYDNLGDYSDDNSDDNEFADDGLLPVKLPQRISRENDEKIIELMAERMMDLSSSDNEDEYEIEKKKKKDKKKKEKKKDKKKKDKKKEKKKKNK